jgi:hypothetical protein
MVVKGLIIPKIEQDPEGTANKSWTILMALAG